MLLRKSIVLVTVDCLRADHCGFMGYPRSTTPFLDEIARTSFVFPTAIVAGVPTYYSFPAILASRYPLAFGREVVGLAVEEKTIASVLHENGYQTGFFGAGNPYLSARFGYDYGFDTFRDFLNAEFVPPVNSNEPLAAGKWKTTLNDAVATVSHRIPGLASAYDELYFQYCQRWAAHPNQSFDQLRRFPSADVIVEQACEWVTSVGANPFFLWLHFMDPHAPYYPTESALEILGEGRPSASRARYVNACWNRSDIGVNRLRRYRDQMIALYDAGIRWVDAQLARLADAMHRLNVWENCIFAFTGDHGEEFLEHAGRFHAPSLTEELIRIPLLIRVSGTETRAVASNPFSLLHLAPTLLEAADVAAPDEFNGHSHWKSIREGAGWSEPAICESIAGCTNPFRSEQRRGARLLAVREARYKLVLNFESADECLFDLKSDPAEQTPLPRQSAKPERRRLLEIARAHVEHSSISHNSKFSLWTRAHEIGLNLINTTTSAVLG
jgi:arylsulfatase A-like enzyme